MTTDPNAWFLTKATEHDEILILREFEWVFGIFCRKRCNYIEEDNKMIENRFVFIGIISNTFCLS